MTIVSADDHGPLVNVGMWVALAPACMMAFFKVYTKWDALRKLQMDDLFMVFALLVATAQSVATTEQVHNGLGRNQDSLTGIQLDTFFLCEYVVQILYVVTIYSAKLVGLSFFIILAGPYGRKAVVRANIAFIALWTVISVFVLAFRCPPPLPWLGFSGGCINESSFWAFNAVIDILTQLIVAILPYFLLRSLQVKRSKKLLSILSFTPNLLTIPITIIRLVYLLLTPRSVPNYTWFAFTPALLTSLHAILSILFAGIPFAKPLIDGMVLVPLGVSDDSRGYAATVDRHSKGGSAAGPARLRTYPKSMLDSLTHWPRPSNGPPDPFANAFVEIEEEEELHDFRGSDGSREQIVKAGGHMAIRQTKSITVTSTVDTQGEDSGREAVGRGLG